MEKFTLGLIVNNGLGVLSRIAGLFNKMGCNIESLTVGPTEDGTKSQMTIVSMADSHTRAQVIKQLKKLIDVKAVDLLKLGERSIIVKESEDQLIEQVEKN